MIYLRDIKENKNYRNIILGILFGILGIVVPTYIPKYGLIITVTFFIIGSLFLFSTTKLNKMFEGIFSEKIIIKDSFYAVARDKDGNIKDERSST